MSESKSDRDELICGSSSLPEEVMICDFNIEDWVNDDGNIKSWNIYNDDQLEELYTLLQQTITSAGSFNEENTPYIDISKSSGGENVGRYFENGRSSNDSCKGYVLGRGRPKQKNRSDICNLIGFIYRRIIRLNSSLNGLLTISNMGEFVSNIRSIYKYYQVDGNKSSFSGKYSAAIVDTLNWDNYIGNGTYFKIDYVVLKNLLNLENILYDESNISSNIDMILSNLKIFRLESMDDDRAKEDDNRTESDDGEDDDGEESDDRTEGDDRVDEDDGEDGEDDDVSGQEISNGTENWSEFQDDDGNYFWYNSENDESKWAYEIWEKKISKSTGETYYFNTLTSISQWDIPNGYIIKDDDQVDDQSDDGQPDDTLCYTKKDNKPYKSKSGCNRRKECSWDPESKKCIKDTMKGGSKQNFIKKVIILPKETFKLGEELSIEHNSGWKRGTIVNISNEDFDVKFDHSLDICPEGESIEINDILSISPKKDKTNTWENKIVNKIFKNGKEVTNGIIGNEISFKNSNKKYLIDRHTLIDSNSIEYICKFCHTDKKGKCNKENTNLKTYKLIKRIKNFDNGETMENKMVLDEEGVSHYFDMENQKGGEIYSLLGGELYNSSCYVLGKDFFNLLTLIYNTLSNRLKNIISSRLTNKSGKIQYFIPGKEKNRNYKFFSYKRMGDWGQVIISKYNNYVFMTFDRLAFAFAMLCNSNCILQTNTKSDSEHNYRYKCFKRSIKSGSNLKTQSGQWVLDKKASKLITNNGRLVRTDMLFEGIVYDKVRDYCMENLEYENEDEFKTILHILLMSLDSYHDWKGGERPWQVKYESILSCMNIDGDLKDKIILLYKIICQSESGRSCAVGKKTFESDIVDTIIRIAEKEVDKLDELGIHIFEDNYTYNYGKQFLTIKFPYKDTILFPKVLQNQALGVYNLFSNPSIPDNTDKYLIDALQNQNLCRFLSLSSVFRYEVKFINNYYSKFDGASGKYHTMDSPFDVLIKHICPSNSFNVFKEEGYMDYAKEEKAEDSLNTFNWENSNMNNMTMQKIYKRYGKNISSSLYDSSSCRGTYGSKRGKISITPLGKKRQNSDKYKEFMEIIIALDIRQLNETMGKKLGITKTKVIPNKPKSKIENTWLVTL